MKKYNEGYTLPFVLVVFLIISLVAVSILTVSIHNLHGQKVSVQRMEEQYAAQGEIEKVVAEVISLPESTAFNEGELNTLCGQTVTAGDWHEETEESVSFTLKTSKDTVEIFCKVILSGIDKTEVAAGVPQYRIQNPEVTYEFYTISTVEPPAEGKGGGT